MRYYLTIYLSGMLVMAAMDEIDLLGANLRSDWQPIVYVLMCS